jgi:hypothetical protein
MIESDKKESDKKTCRSLMVELSSFKGKDEGSVPSGRTKIGDKEFIQWSVKPSMAIVTDRHEV